MSLTQRFKVTFEFTHIVSAEDANTVDKTVIECAKFLSGKVEEHPMNSRQAAEGLVLAALNGGREGAVAYLVKAGMREFVRKEIKEDGFKVGPATVRVIRGGKQ